MNIFEEGTFFNPTRGQLSLSQTLEEMLSYMQERSEYAYEIVVGCDSPAVLEPFFPVVIVVLRKGGGGRFFLKRIFYPNNRKFHSLHQRILEEVLLSCQLAIFLRGELEKQVGLRDSSLNFSFRYIHADVGEIGPTKDMVKEVTGLIRGNGFEPCIKPNSFAASTVADRFS
ncbi:MAG: ribonuclease H-like YkuK family protein [bacterium]|nr:ribonuclease H-like YkuK family protein [bacterium]